MDSELYVIVDPKGFWCRENTIKRALAILLTMGSIPERVYVFKIVGVKGENFHHFWWNGIELMGLPGHEIKTFRLDLPRSKLELISEALSDLDDAICPEDSE